MKHFIINIRRFVHFWISENFIFFGGPANKSDPLNLIHNHEMTDEEIENQIALACSRGLLYYSCRKFAEAQLLFLRALELDPFNSLALGYLKKTQRSIHRKNE